MKAHNVPGLAMSRSLGDVVASEVGVISVPEVFELELKDTDKIIVIASDGIWGVLSNERVIEIASRFFKRGNAEGACENLVDEALEAWHRDGEMIDDITLIVVFLK
jgi:serine/threonine protein phosphatase PrpC